MIKGNSLARVSRRACLRVLTMPLMLSGLVGATQSIPRPAFAAGTHLPTPDSLSRMLTSAGHDRIPIVALFSRAGCSWCEALRREQLVHLARNADTRGVRVVEFDIADQRAFVRPERPERPDHTARQRRPDSSQNRTDPRPAHDDPGRLSAAESPVALAAQLKIRLAPTLVFLGPDGELAERLVGYSSPDFYGAYLDQRIDETRRGLRAAH